MPLWSNEERLIGRSATSGRIDDNLESIKKRFVTYEKETKPIIDYFASINKIYKVNAEQTVDKVFADLKAYFDPIFKK